MDCFVLETIGFIKHDLKPFSWREPPVQLQHKYQNNLQNIRQENIQFRFYLIKLLHMITTKMINLIVAN